MASALAAIIVVIVWATCDDSGALGPPADTDGDGLSDALETFVYGTSPVLADTDGDGYSDYVEIVERAFDPVNAPYRFNPRIADIPELGIVLTSPPIVLVQMTDTTGQTWTIQNSVSDTNSI